MDRDRRRELSARAHHLRQNQPTSKNLEHGHGVAPGIHGQKSPAIIAKDERALRRERVNGRTRRDGTVPSGVVGLRIAEGPIWSPLVGHDLVAGWIICLYENGRLARRRKKGGRSQCRRS